MVAVASFFPLEFTGIRESSKLILFVGLSTFVLFLIFFYIMTDVKKIGCVDAVVVFCFLFYRSRQDRASACRDFALSLQRENA